MIAGSSLFFPMIHIKCVVFLSLWPRTVKILISNSPRTREFSQLFKNTGGKTFSYHGHALVTLYVRFLYSDWSKFDRWVHPENSYIPGHTPGIWHLCRPREEGIWWSESSKGWGIWSPCFRGGEFELHPRFHVKSLAWRAMGDAVLEDFRGKDCAFVAN